MLDTVQDLRTWRLAVESVFHCNLLGLSVVGPELSRLLGPLSVEDDFHIGSPPTEALFSSISRESRELIMVVFFQL